VPALRRTDDVRPDRPRATAQVTTLALVSEPPSTDLVRRAARALAAPAGAARRTSEITFESTPLTWEDVPATLRSAAEHPSPVVADGAAADGALYDEPGGIVQVMRAWRAHRDRVYVAVAARAVHVIGGELRPITSWEPVGLRRHDAAGEPRRRIGWVPVGGPVQAEGPSGSPHGSGGPSAPPERRAPGHAGAAEAWPYLPQPVRAGAERAVPVPDDWIGDLVQRSVPATGMPLSQEVTVMRRDSGTAVVIRATREVTPAGGVSPTEQAAALAAADWLVEQVVLAITSPKQLESTREMPTWM
jgi:hypothetical protein